MTKSEARDTKWRATISDFDIQASLVIRHWSFSPGVSVFFRFGAALVLVVLISLAGTALEKRNLELRRVVSRQQYRLEVLLEQHAANRVLAQQLGAPSRLVEQADSDAAAPANSSKSAKPERAAAHNPRHKSPPAHGD